MSQSLSRALRILIELGEGERSLDQVAAILEVHKTTAMRLLHTLEADRFVRRDDHQRYHLGSRLFALGTMALAQHAIRDVAQPHLARLAAETGGQAVHLAAYENGAAIYLAKVESTHSVRMYSRVGLPAALHATAVGKVLVADLPPGERDAVIAGIDFRPFTSRTIADAAGYRDVLARTREQGWVEDAGEHEDFINCVGAPVRDEAGRVIAAVSVSVPDVILPREGVRALVPQLLAATEAISADWAGRSS
ncbi:IclR family transcriptional regulator [Nocardioides sp.]|uniref:IclR family transcriptional regulator n=1 Tax=Nocardioides sp. TaxID=35761 RepID=UPI0019BA9459|nr:IclR family transcriptional regulator [Nocardioides sp.]MBC7276540.1 IclR family transcriptional regulator [Nocardioides sp.]